ncbi:hypothetical protein CFOL_v3_09834 [Cephalotus follicularis]|uniref:Uncharacterized protein n=1 Tax=Cephalotus follicularis TaxID=3775 RepID=A0A1Q3BEP8_CEPFO|nr:hypothetical protein CFOL_v3_09834 [Cephalotus follicularis]
MEGNEFPWELNLISAINPLISCFIALYTPLLLYFPQKLIDILLSPVPILTAILLLSLLRLGATQKTHITNTAANKQNTGIEAQETAVLLQEHNWVTCQPIACFDPDPGFEEDFVEWDVRAPLEVIYEAHEGEEEEEENDSDHEEYDPTRLMWSPLYYPETDSDSSSQGDLRMSGDLCFRWGEEDRDWMIEIPLDGDNSRIEMGFHVEEENLIEIDI